LKRTVSIVTFRPPDVYFPGGHGGKWRGAPGAARQLAI
uniref:MBL fold metallo-hydrolase n=1 Tax=Anisakis simplex TaxID=6269 RepID=A0A0M3JJV0_ANISI